MKKLLASMTLVLSFALGAFAQTPSAGGAEIELVKEVHDFGNMKQYGDATTEFRFKNTGDEPLIISHAQGSCGCTVPKWPKEPIQPGDEGVIKVKYDSKRVGPINKSVTISSNASNSPTKVIRIKGNIEAAPKETGMPVNKTPGAPVAK